MGGGVTKALTDRVEGHLVNCLKTRARMGHPCHKEELKLLVGEYVTKLKIKTPFKNNIPGDCWYQNFMQRHPSLSLKKPELLQKARTQARRPHVVYDFYDILKKEVDNNNIADKPHYIFNTDESGFHSDPHKLRAIGEKGTPLSRITGGSGRESTSVLGCVAADGTFLPPCIVFKGAAVQARWVSDKAYPGTLFGATKNGWMEEPTFHNWLVNGFIPFVNNIREVNNESDPKVILIYDGHSSHISIRIVEDAIKANIILIKFPSHLTDRIQPLDKCVFGPVKTAWDKKLVEHGVKQMGKGSAHLSKEKFTELLGEVWADAFTSKNIVAGFRTTGVFPVDASKFPKKLFNKNELQIYQNLLHAITDSSSTPLFPSESAIAKPIEIPIQELLNEPSLIDEPTPHSSSSENPEGVLERVKTYHPRPTTSDYSNFVKNLTDSIVAKVDEPAQAVDIQCSSFEKPVNSKFIPEVIDESAILHCDELERSGVSNKADLSTDGSSSLLNNILKMISLDTSTNDTVKTKILKALSSPDVNEENDIMSPNKVIMDELFKIQTNTPEKKKKVVIPRLKVATYGEVLTSDAVKERLKKAEEDKKSKGLKIKDRVESHKNKGKGKRTKCDNEDANKENKQKKLRLHMIDHEGEEQQNSFSEPGPSKQKKIRIYETDSESEEEQNIVPYAESDESDYNVECETEDNSDFLETMATDNLIKGNFVIVQFRGGKRLTNMFRYLCIVDNIDAEDTSEMLVTSLKSVDSSKQVFALQEKDTCCVSIGDIIGLLPEPLIALKGERIFYKFPKPIDIKEKA